MTFVNNFVDKEGRGGFYLLAAIWVLYLFSILVGILTMMKLTGEIASPAVAGPNAWKGPIRLLSGVQLISFLLAMVLTVALGVTRF